MAQHSMMTSLKISGSGTMPSNPLTAAHLQQHTTLTTKSNVKRGSSVKNPVHQKSANLMIELGPANCLKIFLTCSSITP